MTKSNGVWNVIPISHTCKKSSWRTPCPTKFHYRVIFDVKSSVLFTVKKQENEICGPRSSSGWVLTYVRTFRMTFQTFLILSYDPKLHSWLFTVQKPGKWNYGGEEFFRMSSYICQNFHFFILYNFWFDHMVLRLILYIDFHHMRIFLLTVIF